MGKFVIDGAAPLVGEIELSGSKNAALPVIFASIITDGISRVTSLPDIGDVRIALRLIEEQGAIITTNGNDTYIDTRNMSYKPPDETLVCKLRASTYLIGSCLARFGRIRLGSFGGCSFCARPIDMHIDAALSFGADLDADGLCMPSLHAAQLHFDKPSVGATVNALIMASCAQGVSRIYGTAREPHIFTLIEYLRSAGAEITVEDDCMCVVGAALGGGEVRVPADMIEAGTFLFASALTDGAVRVIGAESEELDSFLPLFEASGAEVIRDGAVTQVQSRPTQPVHILASPYPGFPTDLQPIAAPLIACSAGGSISDTVFPTRFGYLSELARLGAGYELYSGRAVLYPSRLHSGTAAATDLRGGAALVLAALAAQGQSEIYLGENVLRGYERFCHKLTSVGARIKYTE